MLDEDQKTLYLKWLDEHGAAVMKVARAYTHHHDDCQDLAQEIHQLPKNDMALVLLYLDEVSYRDMADVLGISENHVGVKLNRAKKALAALMNGESHGT